MTLISRRRALQAPAALAAAFLFRDARAADAVVEIHMRSDQVGAHVWFDPIGVLLDPGQTVRWVCGANYHTATAYHPQNAHHSLRIPEQAVPWNSDVLAPSERFEITLTIEGTYDYFCAPHEAAGMVGRLIVGHPGGPGSRPFDWFKGTAEGRTWADVPAAACAAFPAAEDIVRRHTVIISPP